MGCFLEGEQFDDVGVVASFKHFDFVLEQLVELACVRCEIPLIMSRRMVFTATTSSDYWWHPLNTSPNCPLPIFYSSTYLSMTLGMNMSLILINPESNQPIHQAYLYYQCTPCCSTSPPSPTSSPSPPPSAPPPNTTTQRSRSVWCVPTAATPAATKTCAANVALVHSRWRRVRAVSEFGTVSLLSAQLQQLRPEPALHQLQQRHHPPERHLPGLPRRLPDLFQQLGLHPLPVQLLPGLQRLRALPRRLHRLRLLLRLHLHRLLRQVLPQLAQLHRLLLPLRQLPRLHPVPHLPGRLLPLRHRLQRLPPQLHPLRLLRLLHRLRLHLLPQRLLLPALRQQLRPLPRRHLLPGLQRQLLALNHHQPLHLLCVPLRQLQPQRLLCLLPPLLLPRHRTVHHLHQPLHHLHRRLRLLPLRNWLLLRW